VDISIAGLTFPTVGVPSEMKKNKLLHVILLLEAFKIAYA